MKNIVDLNIIEFDSVNFFLILSDDCLKYVYRPII